MESVRSYLAGCLALLALTVSAHAGDIPKKYHNTVDKGLDWLARQQADDGSWSGPGGAYPVALTALAGLALSGDGSTPTQGKHAPRLKRAAEWLMQRSTRGGDFDGLFGNVDNPKETSRYMFQHGYAMLFLARMYGEVEDRNVHDRVLRRQFGDVLTRAVAFSARAQTSSGGWFYTSKQAAHDSAEGMTTATHLWPLREARNAGILVPKGMLEKARVYCENSTTEKGGVVYSLKGGAAFGGEQPSVTAIVLGSYFRHGNEGDAYSKKWFSYCKGTMPAPGVRHGYAELAHFYFAKAVWELGDAGWLKLFPDSRPDERLTWTKHRQALFDHLQQTQLEDGSWASTGFSMGPSFVTALHLMTLQLDRSQPLPLTPR